MKRSNTLIASFGLLFALGWVVAGSSTASTPPSTPVKHLSERTGDTDDGREAETVHTEESSMPVAFAGPPHAAELAARDPAEWQGMPVDLSMQPICAESETCGLAMACLDRRCGPCSDDGDCARGEGCAVQHCMPAANIDCRSRKDCAHPDAVCMLSGISDGPRGNSEMKAYCSGDEARFKREVEARRAREAQREAAAAASGAGADVEAAPVIAGSPEQLLQLLNGQD